MSFTKSIASDIGFNEGPVWAHGRLLVTSIDRGLVYYVDLRGDEAPQVAARPGGGPNGATVARDGSVWVTQNGGHVLAGSPEPVVQPGVMRAGSEQSAYVISGVFQSPNDLAFGPDGRLWFTDPPPVLDRAAPRPGRVYRADSEGGASPVGGDLLHPNGLAFHPAGEWLYVTDTVQRTVFRRSIAHDDAPWERFTRTEGEPDGLAFDERGRLYVACHGDHDAVEVYDDQGASVFSIETPGMFLTNVCFAGDDLSTLVATHANGVLAMASETPGSPLFT